MKLMRLTSIYVLALVVLSVSACNKDKTPKEETGKQVDLSLSRKIATVSKEFLAPEMVRMREESHAPMVVFAKEGTGIAYVEPFKNQFRVVHNGKAGKAYIAISELQISSDGKRVAYAAAVNNEIYRMVVDGREGHEFGEQSNHWFTPDGKHHISTVYEDDRLYLVIEGNVHRKYDIARSPKIRPDSQALAFSAKTEVSGSLQFIISDIDLRNEVAFGSCGDYILPSDDLSRLAVGCTKEGIHTLKTIDFNERHMVSKLQVDGEITRMKFSSDNNSLPYTVIRPGFRKYIIWNGREEKIPEGEEFFSDPLVLAEPEGIGVIIGNVYRAWLHVAFQKEKKGGEVYGFISDFVASRDGLHYAYVATKQNEHQMQVVVDGHEGPKFDRVVSPLFTPDGLFIVYRARQDGRRFLVVSDMKGKLIKRHRAYDMVFQPVFTDEGKSVAYGVLDGNEFWWKVEKL